MAPGSTFIYDEFTKLPLQERIDWIDTLSLHQVKEQYDSRIIKRFFGQLFEREANTYIKQKSVEYISELTLINVIRYDFTKDFLLEEVLTTGNTFIDTTRLKYLFLLYGDDQECYQVFVKESQKEDNELSSEACFRAGLVHLLYRVSQAVSEDVINELLSARNWFDMAQQHIENRIDARFFSLTSQYLLTLLSLQPESADDLFNELTQTLWARKIWGALSDSELLEYRVFWSLSNLRVIAKNTSKESNWTDYKKEFFLLSNYYNELLLSNDLSPRFRNSFQAFAKHPITALLNRYYVHNLSACQVKIEAIIADADPSEKQLLSFLSDLKIRLEAYREKKNDNPIGTIAALCSGFPYINSDEIIHDVDQLVSEGTPELLIQAQLATLYATRMRLDRVNYATGYPVGDELLQSMIVRLKQLLPEYPPERMAIFISVLSDLIRYTYQAETQQKKFFPHLYDPTIKLEEVFHNHLYTRLTASERAANYHYEESDVVGASRLDIVYRENNVVFPIEVKKTDQQPDWESVKRNYVAQVQMYNRPYNQLGCLVIFDISSKQDGRPLSDIRSLVEVLHLTTYYSIQERYPDYVVAIIIPGNKVSPSNYTTYS